MQACRARSMRVSSLSRGLRSGGRQNHSSTAGCRCIDGADSTSGWLRSGSRCARSPDARRRGTSRRCAPPPARASRHRARRRSDEATPSACRARVRRTVGGADADGGGADMRTTNDNGSTHDPRGRAVRPHPHSLFYQLSDPPPAVRERIYVSHRGHCGWRIHPVSLSSQRVEHEPWANILRLSVGQLGWRESPDWDCSNKCAEDLIWLTYPRTPMSVPARRKRQPRTVCALICFKSTTTWRGVSCSRGSWRMSVRRAASTHRWPVRPGSGWYYWPHSRWSCY